MNHLYNLFTIIYRRSCLAIYRSELMSCTFQELQFIASFKTTRIYYFVLHIAKFRSMETTFYIVLWDQATPC